MGYHQLPSINYIFITTLIITIISTINHITRPVYGKQHFYLKNEIWRNPPVKYRCQSGRDDTGVHELKPGQTLDYRFTDILSSALYFCHFYFEQKDKVFDVYTRKLENRCRALGRFKGYWYDQCYNYHMEWVIRKDGFHGRCVYYKSNYCWSPKIPAAPKSVPLVFYRW
ncbi:hypothetical protein RND81_11G022500 [Saponaria officinalis]|uniref:S-protein homolog n=1 Tax=Saponaria officinalis TaxID=3572 RepID=A0AAW1HIN3_SAPOF